MSTNRKGKTLEDRSEQLEVRENWISQKGRLKINSQTGWRKTNRCGFYEGKLKKKMFNTRKQSVA